MFEKLQKELRKLIQKLLKTSERQIKKDFETVLRDIIAEVGTYYAKLEKDGKLTYAEMAKYNRLQRLEKSIQHQIQFLSKRNRETIFKLLRESHQLSYEWMAWAIERESLARLAYSSVTLDVIDATINAPIGGRTLKGRLAHWELVTVDNLFREITQGLVQGDTYRTMATRIKESIGEDYKDTIRIARTETHRVYESASHSSAERANSQGVKMVKRWNSVHDERVRDTSKANHRAMDGQEVPVDEDFELLPSGGKGKAPGNTGRAAHDINCRCFATYRIVGVEKKQHKEMADLTFEEWKKERLRQP